MTTLLPSTQDRPASSLGARKRYMLVSVDSHVGPSVSKHLREYCEAKYLDAFDEDIHKNTTHIESNRGRDLENEDPLGAGNQGGQTVAATSGASRDHSQSMLDRWAAARAVAGLQDPHARLKDMDEQGVAADVIFAGGQNDELLPFDTSDDPELQAVGAEIFNRWMVDFCSVDPLRLHGVAQLSMHDIPAAIRSVEKAKEQGFSSVNFPAPRRGLLPYSEDAYEPFWAACEALDMPLNTHGGGGERGYWTGRGARYSARAEGQFMARRGLWGLIFSGAFERHPGLKFVLTEQMAGWVPQTLAQLDGIWLDNVTMYRSFREALPHKPSEYWQRQVFIGDSFMSRPEAQQRHEVGLYNIMYGTDYPHAESVFPLTRLALRQAFSDVPSDEVQLMVGDNAVRCFGLDAEALRSIGDRIGPTVAEIAVAPTEEELAKDVPPFCLAFRDY
jgi:predicted TIM-barrel fold metal-dependent hydrolase